MKRGDNESLDNDDNDPPSLYVNGHQGARAQQESSVILTTWLVANNCRCELP